MNELVALQNADQILNATLAMTLAGLSITMAILVFGPLHTRIEKTISNLKKQQQSALTADLKHVLYEHETKMKSTARECEKNLITALVVFIAALIFIVVFDTYGELYSENLRFEIMDIIVTGFPLILGLFYFGKCANLIIKLLNLKGKKL